MVFKHCMDVTFVLGNKPCLALIRVPIQSKQNATFSPNFTQPGKSPLEIPYMVLAHAQVLNAEEVPAP